jgi:hypothetical protein
MSGDVSVYDGRTLLLLRLVVKLTSGDGGGRGVVGGCGPYGGGRALLEFADCGGAQLSDCATVLAARSRRAEVGIFQSRCY